MECRSVDKFNNNVSVWELLSVLRENMFACGTVNLDSIPAQNNPIKANDIFPARSQTRLLTGSRRILPNYMLTKNDSWRIPFLWSYFIEFATGLHRRVLTKVPIRSNGLSVSDCEHSAKKEWNKWLY